MESAFDIAAYIVNWFGRRPKGENDLTQLKLQKLLYYCQGHYLALTNEPLFDLRVEAWEHGPVVPDVYTAYAREYGQGIKVILRPVSGDSSKLNAATKDFLKQVLEVRGQYSAWRLRQLTHDEPPWKDSYQENQRNEISLDAMRNYFQGFIRK